MGGANRAFAPRAHIWNRFTYSYLRFYLSVMGIAYPV